MEKRGLRGHNGIRPGNAKKYVFGIVRAHIKPTGIIKAATEQPNRAFKAFKGLKQPGAAGFAKIHMDIPATAL
jgi:hypothetical protein